MDAALAAMRDEQRSPLRISSSVTCSTSPSGATRSVDEDVDAEMSVDGDADAEMSVDGNGDVEERSPQTSSWTIFCLSRIKLRRRGILTWTLRTNPSSPGNTCSILAKGHDVLGFMSSTSYTNSPTFKLGTGRCHFSRV
jgi:hypothetical protein